MGIESRVSALERVYAPKKTMGVVIVERVDGETEDKY